jgi:hypothetical protein
MTKAQKVVGITAAVFVTEAMIHYNIGVNKGKQKFQLEFPKGKELVRIVATVLVASVVSNMLVKKYA